MTIKSQDHRDHERKVLSKMIERILAAADIVHAYGYQDHAEALRETAAELAEDLEERLS